MSKRNGHRKRIRSNVLFPVAALGISLIATLLVATFASYYEASLRLGSDSNASLAAATLVGGTAFSFVIFWLAIRESKTRALAQRESLERLAVEDKLALAHSRLQSLIAQAPLAIQVLSPDGITVEVNRAFERLWPEDVRDWRAIDIRQDFKARFPDSLPYLKRAFAGFQTAVPIIERPGADAASRRFITAHAYPLKDENGDVRELVLIYQDLTDVKQAEEEVRRVNAYLEHRVAERTAELVASMAEMEAFSYSVAHDLRTPLRAMGSFARILVDEHGSNLSPDAKAYLNRIVENSLRMGDLIDGLLDLARVARAPLDFDLIDVSATAAEAIRALQRRDPSRNLEVVIEQGILLVADKPLMQAVLQNLIENAWKFTRLAATPRIEIGKVDRPEGVQVFVRDNGVGFDPTYIGKLFRPFERLHNSEEFPGTGIGLATVRRIVERHGGRVWAEGTPGKGACFSFAIPAHPTMELVAKSKDLHASAK